MPPGAAAAAPSVGAMACCRAVASAVEFESAAEAVDDGTRQALAGTSDEQLIAMLVDRVRGHFPNETAAKCVYMR